MRKPGIAGVGCALLDILYPDAKFNSPGFDRYRSQKPGDGGLVPGQLVFASALESYAGVSIDRVIDEICGTATPHRNLGGPAIVALVLASQLLAHRNIPVEYYGVRGNDDIGDRIEEIIGRTGIDVSGLRRRRGTSASTRVLSDPSAANGGGERTFINDLGVAADFRVRDIPAEFFDRQVAYFGGTGLVPRLHEEIGEALYTARGLGSFTVVATVYDFLNESRAPDQLWPLGNGQRDYPLIDLLIADAEEAHRLSGQPLPASAIRQFLDWGAGAAIVTSGADPVWFGARPHRFAEIAITSLPVSAEVARRAPTADSSSRDTTGCGDNFAGGVLASITTQLATRTDLDLRTAVIEGVAAGAAAWFQLGGTRIETYPGETRERVTEFREAYYDQIGEG